MNILIFSMPPQTLKNHRETFSNHRETFSIHRETLFMYRETFSMHRETLFMHRETFPIHRETFSMHRETLKRHRETFSEDNFPEETREYLFPAKETKITKLKLHTAAEEMRIVAHSGKNKIYFFS